MAFIIPATGGTSVKQAGIVVNTGAQKGSLLAKKRDVPFEPDTIVEVSGRLNLDSRFDDVNYYVGGTGNY